MKNYSKNSVCSQNVMKYFVQILSDLFVTIHISHLFLLETLGSFYHAVLGLPLSVRAPSLSLSTEAPTFSPRLAVGTPLRGSPQATFSLNPLSVFSYKDLYAQDPPPSPGSSEPSTSKRQPDLTPPRDTSRRLELATPQVHFQN